MLDDVDDIGAFYDSDPEREHVRLEEHRLEHDLTWRYLDRYLPAEGAILDVGAATGRYAIPLAKRGYRVTAVDLSSALVERGRRRSAELGLSASVDWVVSDARDLRMVGRREFDATLLLGPLYHLIEESDRRLAIRQARDRMREGAVVFAAFLSRLGVLADLIKRSPAWIHRRDEVRALLDQGSRPPTAPRGGFRGYFARVEEIRPLLEGEGFHTVLVAGVEPVIAADDASFNRLEGDEKALWLQLLEEVAENESTLGSSRHLLYVGRKPGTDRT